MEILKGLMGASIKVEAGVLILMMCKWNIIAQDQEYSKEEREIYQ